MLFSSRMMRETCVSISCYFWFLLATHLLTERIFFFSVVVGDASCTLITYLASSCFVCLFIGGLEVLLC